MSLTAYFTSCCLRVRLLISTHPPDPPGSWGKRHFYCLFPLFSSNSKIKSLASPWTIFVHIESIPTFTVYHSGDKPPSHLTPKTNGLHSQVSQDSSKQRSSFKQAQAPSTVINTGSAKRKQNKGPPGRGLTEHFCISCLRPRLLISLHPHADYSPHLWNTNHRVLAHHYWEPLRTKTINHSGTQNIGPEDWQSSSPAWDMFVKFGKVGDLSAVQKPTARVKETLGNSP